MKNKNVIIVIIVLVLVVLVGGGYFVLSSSKNKPVEQLETSIEEPIEDVVNALMPEDIGLTLIATPDSKKVIMEITKVEDISSLEYQLSYASKGDIPRGAIGTLEPKGKPVKQEIVLGTCSDVCHMIKKFPT